MYFQILLVVCLFLEAVSPGPFHISNANENSPVESSSILLTTENPLESQNFAKGNSTTPAAHTKGTNDLLGQETFYPLGISWHGWGGYRPWFGLHWGGRWGHRPWYGPHWGGSWGHRPWRGPHWGGHWGDYRQLR